MTFPAHRFAPLIAAYVDRVNAGRDRYDEGGYTALAELAGCCSKTLRRIARGEQAWVDEDTADRIVLALDLEYLWVWPAERGGFADLTERASAQLVLELGAAA